MLGFLTCLSAQVFAQSSIVQLYQSPFRNVAAAITPNGWMAFPRAIGFDIKTPNDDLARQILLNWGKNKDSVTIPSVFAHKMSANGGSTYGSEVHDEPNVNFGNAMRKKDGEILCLPFLVKDPSYSPLNTFYFDYHTSIDTGKNWIAHVNGAVNFPTGVYWMKIDRGMFEYEDALYAPIYVSFANNGGTQRCSLIKSVDQGNTWNWYADITNPAIDPIQYSEPTVSICANGDWLAVLRVGERLPLKYSRSTNHGVTWSPAQPLPGLPIESNDNDNFNESVDPFLQLMPNGIMVLTYGRPNSHLAFSYDGSGANWTYLTTSFKEVPGIIADTTLGFQSTNYTALVPTGYNKFILYGDRGANWTYYSKAKPFTNVPHPQPNPFRIWEKNLEIVTNRQNRIDLKKKILYTWATVMMPQTTLTYSSPSHLETRPLGAVDGSTDYWSSAIGTGSGVLQLDLHKKYNINSVGLAMLFGKEQSATVELSEDLLTWIPVETYTNEIHRSIHYTDITPRLARYVRVTVSGSGQIGVGELELYQTASTFEANAATPTSIVHGVIPYGYALYGNTASKHGISVRDVYGYQSNRALTLYDGNDNYIAGIKKIEAASNKKILEFRFRAVTIPAGQFISMRILGTVSGSENTIFYVAVMPDGSIKANQGGGFTVDIAPANTIERGSLSAWSLIKIEADESANIAKVYLDGILMGSCTMFPAPLAATTLTGFAFASYGTDTWGELAYFDDINFYNPDTEGPSGLSAGPVQQQQLKSLPAELPGKFSIKVSPNPAKDIVNIQVSHTAEGKIRLTVLNAFGMPVKTINALSSGDGFSYDLPTGNFQPGMYVISAQQDNKIVRTKVIIMP